ASESREFPTINDGVSTNIVSQSLNSETNEFLRSIAMSEDFVSFRAYGKLADGTVHYSNMIGLATDLFFSEYIEGSSNNKALEIFNGTGRDVNLEGYSVLL